MPDMNITDDRWEELLKMKMASHDDTLITCDESESPFIWVAGFGFAPRYVVRTGTAVDANLLALRKLEDQIVDQINDVENFELASDVEVGFQLEPINKFQMDMNFDGANKVSRKSTDNISNRSRSIIPWTFKVFESPDQDFQIRESNLSDGGNLSSHRAWDYSAESSGLSIYVNIWISEVPSEPPDICLNPHDFLSTQRLPKPPDIIFLECFLVWFNKFLSNSSDSVCQRCSFFLFDPGGTFHVCWWPPIKLKNLPSSFFIQ
jgi:hypothetical protein